jgi:hypothetical protein
MGYTFRLEPLVNTRASKRASRSVTAKKSRAVEKRASNQREIEPT